MDLSTTITEKPMPLYNTKLIAYPNPVNYLLYVDLNGFESKAGTIHILSFEGRILQEHKTHETPMPTTDFSTHRGMIKVGMKFHMAVNRKIINI